MNPDGKRNGEISVLFSGGTDSTASSALLAEQYSKVHLLTYARHGMIHSEHSTRNAKRLQQRFPQTAFLHQILETTSLAKWLTNRHRWRYIRKYGFFTLQNCGFCALVNHCATASYCLQNGIPDAADGITHDWPFFPGHMDKVISLFRDFYRHFDITYHTPVLHYDVSPPPTFFSKVQGDRSEAEDEEELNTTGRLLRELGLADTDDYKGTELDRRSQARCFQFILPNLFIYWVFRGQERWEEYEAIVVSYFGSLILEATQLLEAYFEKGRHRELFAFLETPQQPS